MMPGLSKHALVRFDYCTEQGANRLIRASIFYPARNWRWELTLDNFEVVHGLSRVVMLMPDKLTTALDIKTELHHDEDGKFLIDLVETLVSFYFNKHQATMASLELVMPEQFQTFEIEIGEGEINTEADMVDLGSVLNNFREAVRELIDEFQQGTLVRYYRDARSLTILADDILLVTKIFLDLVHPVWIGFRRHGFFDNEKIQEYKTQCESKLITLDGGLLREFDSQSMVF